MTTQKNLLIRFISALIGLSLVVGLHHLWGINGLKAVILFAVAVGTFEVAALLFHKENSPIFKNLLVGLSFLVFAASAASLSIGSLAYSLSLIVMISAVLLSSHKKGNLEQMLSVQSKASLGFFYVGLLPSFAFRILDQAYGIFWFVFLLTVVFAGDIFAYIFGVLFGKHKMMPSVSPKKSWQGSAGGLLGAVGASILCWYFFFQNHSLWVIVTLGTVSECLGQFGDFFESLLKRVAGVKDSGKIMPGHGGILDRIDGVLFASPVVLLGILILSHFSL